MSESEATMITFVQEGRMRGGRKNKFIKVVIPANGLLGLMNPKSFPAPREPAGFPALIKLSKLPGLLGVSRASVYRMTKNGLKTVRPTNGDQHVRRGDLEEFLNAKVTTVKRRR